MLLGVILGVISFDAKPKARYYLTYKRYCESRSGARIPKACSDAGLFSCPNKFFIRSVRILRSINKNLMGQPEPGDRDVHHPRPSACSQPFPNQIENKHQPTVASRARPAELINARQKRYNAHINTNGITTVCNTNTTIRLMM